MTSTYTRTFIFSGPTLAGVDAGALLEAVYLPPVSQGDVFRLVRHEPEVIGIIDGYFDHVPAVWHKELLWALSNGIAVYGSASMGALRAAELEPYGMKGVGWIFEQYRLGHFEDDDEVAVAHASEEFGYRRLSEAMVNIRATLARAVDAGVVAPETAGALIAIGKETFYPERSYPMLVQRGRERGLPSAELDALRAWLPTGARDAKQADALEMLTAIRDRRAVPAAEPTFRFEHTDFWAHVMRSEAEGAFERGEATLSSMSDAVIEELRLAGATFLSARDGGLLRELAMSEGHRLGHGTGAEAADQALAQLRARLGIHSDDELSAWLADNDMTIERFAELGRVESQLAKLRWSARGGSQLLNVLRVDDRYRTLAQRARDKAARLADVAAPDPAAHLSDEEILTWYFDRLGPFYRRDATEHANTYGFADRAQFVAAVRREYAYVHARDATHESDGDHPV